MGNLKIQLKPNERIFINGAVVRVDRRVTLELLNEVAFLLEAHLMREEEATTPSRQLYYVVQAMLLQPTCKDVALQIFRELHGGLVAASHYRDMQKDLLQIGQLIEIDRTFEAMKAIRLLFRHDDLLNAGEGGAERGMARLSRAVVA